MVGPTNLFAEKKISGIRFPASPLPVFIPPTTFDNVGAARGDQTKIHPPYQFSSPLPLSWDVTEVASNGTRVRRFLTLLVILMSRKDPDDVYLRAGDPAESHPPYQFSSPLPLPIMLEPPAGVEQKFIPPTSFIPPTKTCIFTVTTPGIFPGALRAPDSFAFL